MFCIETKCLDYYQQGQPEYIQSCNAGTPLHLSKAEIQINVYIVEGRIKETKVVKRKNPNFYLRNITYIVIEILVI